MEVYCFELIALYLGGGKLNKKIILGIAVGLFVCASAIFAFYDSTSKPISENLTEGKLITADEFKEMTGIIEKVNSGELSVSALKDAEAVLERSPYYVKPEKLKAYQELTQ